MSDVSVRWCCGVLQAISHRSQQFQNESCVSEVMWCVAGYFSQIPAVSEWGMCQWGGGVLQAISHRSQQFQNDSMSHASMRWWGGVLQAISHRSQQFQNESCVSEVMRWCVAGYFSQILSFRMIDVSMRWWGVLQAISHGFLQFQNESCVSEVMWWCVAGQIPAVLEWVMCCGGMLQAISHRYLQFQNESCISEVMWCVAGYFSQIPVVLEWVMYWWGDEVVCCRLFLTDPSSFRMSPVSVRWWGGVLQAISHRSQQFQNESCVSEVM